MDNMETVYTALQMNDITDNFDSAEIEEQKLIAIVVYIFSFLFFLPSISYKDSAFAKHTANDSFVIFILLFINFLIIGHIPFIGGILHWIINLVSIGLIALKVLNTSNNKARTLPFGITIPIFK